MCTLRGQISEPVCRRTCQIQFHGDGFAANQCADAAYLIEHARHGGQNIRSVRLALRDGDAAGGGWICGKESGRKHGRHRSDQYLATRILAGHDLLYQFNCRINREGRQI